MRGIGPRGLSISLGVLWLVDAALQAQPFMFTRGFARMVIRPTAAGQPAAVAASVHWGAHVIVAHPAAWNAVFVGVQFLLGFGLLRRRTTRLALAGSIAWALGIWWFGEGAGGLLSGVGILEGAPGAALLYAAVAVLAWPREHAARSFSDRTTQAVWTGLWAAAVVTEIAGSHTTSDAAVAAGAALIVLTAVVHDSTFRRISVAGGLSLAILGWALVQHFGQLASGQATDVGTGPIIVLIGLALLRTTTVPTTSTVPAAVRGQTVPAL